MTPAWAQRREELLRDCIVSPDVFSSMLDRLGEFVMPYQQALAAEVGQHHVHRYLAGLLSHLNRKNAETIAALVDVERQVIQDFIGTAPWDHRPLIHVLVGQVAERLGEPDGIIAFDPSSFPKRGTHNSVRLNFWMVSYFNCTTGKVSHSVKDHTWSARPAAIAGVRLCHQPPV